MGPAVGPDEVHRGPYGALELEPGTDYGGIVLNDRLRRVTDLFIEGTELFFGNDDGNVPILMWVCKLNSFEVEEARRDAAVKRGMRLAELSAPDSPELIAMMATLGTWDGDKLAAARVDQMGEDIYLSVFNDLEIDPTWREKLELVRRGTTLLDDEGAPADDPRRTQITDAQSAYLTAIREGQAKKQIEALSDVKGNSRQTNIDEYLESWRNRTSLDVFIQERRVTEIYVALRDCKGVVRHGEDAALLFDHAACDHSVRVLANRKDVYDLPEAVIERVVDALDGITVPARTAGNSDAPASSSASSEQSSAVEEVSTPSIPVETPPDAVMTSASPSLQHS